MQLTYAMKVDLCNASSFMKCKYIYAIRVGLFTVGGNMVSAVSSTCLCTSSICVAMAYDTILYFAYSYIVMVFES